MQKYSNSRFSSFNKEKFFCLFFFAGIIWTSATILLGAFFHTSILSCIDGIYLVRDKSKTPQGFIITPEEAGFIAINLHQGYGWTVIEADHIYADDENYYILDPIERYYHKNYDNISSYNAKAKGYIINGKTGEILRGNKWEKVGFIMIPPKELKYTCPIGTTRNKVIKQIGYPYPIKNLSNNVDAYYIRGEGEFLFTYEKETNLAGNEKNRLVSIKKAKWIRL